MGFRISFYLLPKRKYNLLKNITEQEFYAKRYKISNIVRRKRIWYDTMTDLILGDNSLSTSFFNNFVPDDDYYWSIITKNQLKRLAEASKEKTIAYLDKKWDMDCYRDYKKDNVDPLFDNKYLIAGGWDYESAMYNLVHLYHTIDFKNNVLVAIGS